jgi:hypothetical protein
MATVTITEILDDLRAADEITRRFERRYWLSSADFYELYSQGLLDDGEHTEDFALWAAFYEIKLTGKKTCNDSLKNGCANSENRPASA